MQITQQQQQTKDSYLSSGLTFQPDLTQRAPPPTQYDTPSLPTSSPLAATSLDVSNLGLFGALSNIKNRARPLTAMHDEISPDMPSLGYEMEQFLIQTYFEMAHSQYPMLLKHQFLKWYESWRTEREKLPVTMRWKGFFVYMVCVLSWGRHTLG